MSLKLRLRNVKCNFLVKKDLTPHLKLFKQHKTNKVLRLGDKICLTVYRNNLLKIHVTGISSLSDFESVLSFFKAINLGISRIQVNNTFWMVKPFIINNFLQICRLLQKQTKNRINYYWCLKRWSQWWWKFLKFHFSKKFCM